MRNWEWGMGHGAWGASALSRAMPDLFAFALGVDRRLASPHLRSTGIMERILLERASKIEHL
ncbi:MAG: hypothetical protein KME22_27345 [Hassallia sp. WJT32-NPBG1]|nr:hypothetical protein [Hassallia sp. WJT32-NPBG1]